MPSHGLTEDDLNADLLTPGEVATLLRVDARTVSRWARDGKLPSIRTVGGHRRFRRAEIQPYLTPTPETEHATDV